MPANLPFYDAFVFLFVWKGTLYFDKICAVLFYVVASISGNSIVNKEALSIFALKKK